MADNAVIAKVNNEVWDLDRPFEGDATLQLLKFDDDDAKAVRISKKRLLFNHVEIVSINIPGILAQFSPYSRRGYGTLLWWTSLLRSSY